MNIRNKVLSVTLSATLLAIVTSISVALITTKDTLERMTFQKLTAVREMKANQIEQYFQGLIGQAHTMADNQMIIDAMGTFANAFDSLLAETRLREDLGDDIETPLQDYYRKEFLPRLQHLTGSFEVETLLPKDQQSRFIQYLYLAQNPELVGQKHRLDAPLGNYTSYTTAHRAYHPILRRYLETFGFYDIFLIDAKSGNIVYSVFKEVDFGTSLIHGPYRDSGLARAFKLALAMDNPTGLSIVDFDRYLPSYGAHAAFIAATIKHNDAVIGVIAFQMPVDRINDLMTDHQNWQQVGMGNSGESYLVGDDKKLRTQSRFLLEAPNEYVTALRQQGVSSEVLTEIKATNSAIGLQEVNSLAVTASLAGKTGSQIIQDYRGKDVLSAYKPLSIPGLNWVILSEIDAEEAFQNVTELQRQFFLLGTVLLGLLAIFAWRISQSITQPIQQLGQAANKLAAGQLDQSVACRSQDEVGELAAIFEKMRIELKQSFDKIQAANDELNERVEVRTADLNTALNKVREDEERITAILAGIQDAVITINMKGHVMTFNTAAERMFGLPAKEIIGQNIKRLMPEPIAGQHDDFLKRQTPPNESGVIDHSRELMARRHNGELFSIDLRVSKINEGDDALYVGLIRDITQQKALEEKEKLVALELQRARDAADQANQAKSDFLANMSHEIRTPMNAVIGLSDLCLMTDLSPKQSDYLNKIHRSATSLLGIINDILDFSKIEAGKLDIESVPYEIDAVLDNLATIVQVKTQQKGIELLFNRDPSLPSTLIGDPLRLSQILINLCNNAAKFTEHGEIVVNIRRLDDSSIGPDKVHLQCSVTDTGIGMNDEQLSRLFRSFSQADTSTTRKYGGTGLGLAISKQLTELMGGSINVTSREGEGSVFTFDIIQGYSDEQTERHFEPASDIRHLNTLLVDDNDTSREILQHYLTAFNYRVTTAKSAPEALAIINRADAPSFDLIVTDYLMPDMSGLEFASMLKKPQSKAAFAKIIMASAFLSNEVTHLAGADNIDDFLSKPVSPSHLFDSIMRVFGHHAISAVRRHNQELKADDPRLRVIQGAHILLVEDNEINQQVASELLEHARFLVDIANHGQEALDRLEHKKYDAVLMDIQMPVMDGYEATRHLRTNKAFNDLPIIAMTANASLEDREKSLAAGMNAHINKPINPSELLGTLLKWIPHKERPMPEAKDQSENPSDQALPQINGIDTLAGLSRVGGNVGSYKKLLKKFAYNQQQAVRHTRAALASGDVETSIRAMHSLKGAAANLGADNLAAQAMNIEDSLKNRPTQDLTEALNTLDESFMQLAALIQQSLQEEDEAMQNISGWTHSELITQIDALVSLLEQYDSGAENALETIVANVADHTFKAQLIEILGVVGQYEFDAAREQLMAIQEDLRS